MARRPIPVHEPEVVSAGAKRRWGDDEKVPTTAIGTLVVDGVGLSSRYDKAHEIEAMRRMVEGVEPHLRRHILSIWCDSKAEACYSVSLDGCDERTAVIVVDQLEEACRVKNGGHNGMWVSGHQGGGLSRDPYWAGDDQL